MIPSSPPITLTLGHSPDADDAFMWWPITGKVDPRDSGRVVSDPVMDTGRFRFIAVPDDIQRLNERAISKADLDITAMSMHALSHVTSAYALTSCGASMGDGYGPKVVMRPPLISLDEAKQKTLARSLRIAIPGRQTTAYLVFSLLMGSTDFEAVPMGFEHIIPAVKNGDADAGIVIHDGQLTFAQEGLVELIDLGAWWKNFTRESSGADGLADTDGLPLPLGANTVKRDLDQRYGTGTVQEVTSILRRSIECAMSRRAESLAYAAGFAPGASAAQTDRFVRMYVNDLTIDMGERGHRAVQRLYEAGHRLGVCPAPKDLVFVRS
mgnify:CR=1 FL=1